MAWLRRDQQAAVRVLAESLGWDQLTVADLRTLMWAAFHYYVMRVKDEQAEAEEREELQRETIGYYDPDPAPPRE